MKKRKRIVHSIRFNKLLKTWLLLISICCIIPFIVQASEVNHELIDQNTQIYKDSNSTLEISSNSEIISGPQEEGEQVEIPLNYIFYWGILIFMMILLISYFVVRYKKGIVRPKHVLAFFLTLFVLILYSIELTSTFSGKFDVKSLEIMYTFHESPALGFLRFTYKFILGILLVFFAFLNMDRGKFRAEDREQGKNIQ